MLDNVSYGANGYATHEESYALENEYHNNHSSMQMMPPGNHMKQHMTFSNETHGSYPDGSGWYGKTNRHQNGWNGPNMHHQNGGYSHAPGGKYPAMPAPGRMPSNNMMMNAPAPAPGRMPSNNMMLNADPASGRMRMQNYGVQCESYSDFANGMQNGHQKVEWKNL